MNWAQSRIFDGAGLFMVFAYLNDLWRVGVALPGREGDQLKQSAAMTFVYAIDLIRLDGVRCADASAPGHRQDQLFQQNRAVIDYLRTLPRDRRMMIGTISLALERATAPLRKDDAVLCSGGLDEIAAGLKAQGGRPLSQVATPPGQVGRTYAVPAAPGYKPGFVAPATWQPRQAAIRATLPAALTTLLTVPGDPPAPPR